MTQALCLLPLFNQILNVVHRQLTAGLQRGSWEQPEPRAWNGPDLPPQFT